VILLARHGETDANVEPIRFQGRTDTPLNERGREQAHELAQVIARDHTVAALYSSDLSRARETAEIVGAAIGLPVREDARFAESYRGDWEGRYFHEIEAEVHVGNVPSWRVLERLGFTATGTVVSGHKRYKRGAD